MTPPTAHEPHVVALTVRERLLQIRAERARGRAPAWLVAGKRWMAFAAQGCACGCEDAPDRPTGRRAAHR